jgi:hypothetical protein
VAHVKQEVSDSSVAIGVWKKRGCDGVSKAARGHVEKPLTRRLDAPVAEIVQYGEPIFSVT